MAPTSTTWLPTFSPCEATNENRRHLPSPRGRAAGPSDVRPAARGRARARQLAHLLGQLLRPSLLAATRDDAGKRLANPRDLGFSVAQSGGSGNVARGG